jgi:hypothetical protein
VITVAPYDPGQTAIDSRTGFIAGAIGAIAMALVVSALNGAGFDGAWFFLQVGSVIVRDHSLPAGTIALAVGMLVHLSLGTLFGMLYASCLRRQATKGVVAVAISYGVLLWIIPGFPLSFAFDETTRSLLRSPAWLAGCLVYSAVLLVITLAKLTSGGPVRTGAH